MTRDGTDPFAPFLAPGERPLWSGRPRQGFWTGDAILDRQKFLLLLWMGIIGVGAGVAVGSAVSEALSGRPIDGLGPILALTGLFLGLGALQYTRIFGRERRGRRLIHYAIVPGRLLVVTHGDQPALTSLDLDRTSAFRQHGRRAVLVGPAGAIQPPVLTRQAVSEALLRPPRPGNAAWLVLGNLEDAGTVLSALRQAVEPQGAPSQG